MTKQSQHELFAQRPVRSDFARGRGGGGGLNLRKLLTVCFVLFAAIGIGFVVNGLQSGESATSEEIPTIHAETPVKLRPEQPGGIDIPHQDVTVFQQLDGSESQPKKSNIEHLLPEPETPQPVTSPQVVTESSQAPVPEAQPTQKVEEMMPPAITEAAPVKEEPAPAQTPVAVVKKEVEKKVSEKDKIVAEKTAAALSAAKKIEKSVKTEAPEAKQSEAASTSRLPKELFTADSFTPPKTADASAPVVAPDKAPPPASAPVESASGKKVQVQLASSPSESQAQAEVKRFANKYAGILGGAQLRVVRAEIAGKGTYYRIMGTIPSEAKAKAICSDIVKQKGNCIVVK